MTDEECRLATEALSDQLDLYARLLVRKGASLRLGQELVLQAPVERADFARRVVDAAYRAGAGHVTVIWRDDEVTRLTYENCDLSFFKTTPSWQVEQLNSLAADGAAFLFLEGSDPAMLKGVDPAKPAAAAKSRNTECRVFRDGMDFGRNAWCIAGVPVQAWAREVFPDLSPAEALYRLWMLILEVSRADGEDPESAWETHNASFEKTKRFLNSHRFDALRYESAAGTDLTVGLTDGHVWDGGAGRTQDGVAFFPNIPTEEVFTSPDRMRAEGVVHSALPLVYSGQMVRDFWLRFEGGRVVDFGAEQGREVLRHIIETDEGSCRLGEVALVSKNTPIRQSETLFFSTLYDENASCHLALGMGFPECIAGGASLSKEGLLARGVNQSSTHVDFMIGTDDLNVYGVASDGTETPVFVNGQWAWE
ncbi:aminopeptidase [Olsenella profusa]|uniref:Aminopeptidase n=2 Tax=Olsenella profusa TaxID=138595 RepID=A0ABS2F0E1_9ACTN|nr:aminopeptidase [Olsenella profusa]MBM6774441.1 aminopeptidase [Olsenella profusa]